MSDRGRRAHVAALAAAAALAAGGCASAQGGEFQRVDAVQARTEIPEEALLDVGIEVFDDGVDESWDQAVLNEKRIYPDIRKSESRYFALLLKETLQATGHWGAVRVVPAGAEGIDVTIRGEIVESNGKDLALRIRAVDALGREWLDQEYEEEADTLAYVIEQEKAMAEKRGVTSTRTQGQELDPYQNLYNRVANDLLAARRRLAADEIREIREVSRLRFAADLAPEAFGGYLRRDDEGEWQLERLPAADDPMLARVERIRERDWFFVDTLNEHYANFYGKMDQPYDEWRMYSFEEQLALEELERSKKKKMILGGLLAAAGVILGDGDSQTEQTLKAGAIYGGLVLVNDGIQKGREAELNKAALEELAISLEADLEPMLIDVEGRTMRLTGSAEAQFETWRKLLRELFEAETGLPVDPNTGSPAGAAASDPGR